MIGFRIRDKTSAHVAGMFYAFFACLVGFTAGEYAGYSSRFVGVYVVAVPIVVGFAFRWGWELRRWHRKTRPGYDPLASLRPK